MRELQDKVAIITGASSGIGRAAAKLFAEEGAQVVVSARREAELGILVEEIAAAGGQAVAVAGDIRDEALAARLVQTATDRFGGLDVAFNNVGVIPERAPVPELSSEGWRESLDVNLTSAFFAAKHQIPAMLARGAGSIIFTSTIVGQTVGFPGMGAYAAAKAGLVGLTQVIAAEFGARGVRANALVCGGVDTPMGRAVTDTPETLAFVTNLHALKRIAAPEEIAQTALHLASDRSSFITGAALRVDGGVSISRS